MTDPVRWPPYARFELARSLRARSTRLAFAVFALVHAPGAWLRLDEDGLFGYAFLGALAIGLGGRLGTDRARGFTQLLRTNFLSPSSRAAGKVAAMLAWSALMAAYAFGVSALLTGAPAGAAWRAAYFFLVAVLLAPGVVLVECAADTRAPALVVMAAAVGGGVASLSLGADPGPALAALGLDAAPHDLRGLGRLAARSTLAAALAWGILVGEGRRRFGSRHR